MASQSDIINVLSIAKLKYANLVAADVVEMQSGCLPHNSGLINCFNELIEALQYQLNKGDFTSNTTLSLYDQLFNLVDINADPNVVSDPNYEYPRTVYYQFVDGVQGPAGPQGEQGIQGEQGETGAQGEQGEQGEKGDTGEKGDAGEQGIQGEAGADGADGDSAYQVWLDNGHAGTVTDFLNSLKGTAGTNGTNGTDGDDGVNGWSPVFAVVSDVNRRVLQVVDWVGGGDDKPATGVYLAANGFTSSLANAIDIRGGTGVTGATGAQGQQGTQGATGQTGATGAQGVQGYNGWSPIFLVAADGDRRVLQIADWTGGNGTKPATGAFIGITGLVATAADAMDIRGAKGLKGDQGSQGEQGPPGPIVGSQKLNKDETDLIDAGGGNYYLPYLDNSGNPITVDIMPFLTLSENVQVTTTYDATTSPPRLYGFANNATQTITVYII